ncbi:MAG: hypothetical protein IJ803_08745 [Oribacterium sp.]|nr:hypothetical protein [Oribacterium sp.]
MAKKAELLKQGANKTGRGLFQGMSRLDSKEESAADEEVKTSDIESESEDGQSEQMVTEQVNESHDDFSEVQTENREAEEKDAAAEREGSLEEEGPSGEATNEAHIELEAGENVRDVKPESIEAKSLLTKEVESEINKSAAVQKTQKKTTDKPASRYEKDKFLLLDIRGYRDYVEHMAKAANMSATKYIRNLIEQDMVVNKDIYEAHKALEEKLKNRYAK